MGVSVAFSSVIIVIAFLISLALILSAISYNLNSYIDSAKKIASYGKVATLVRIVYANVTGVSSSGDMNLTITINNYGSLKLWDFNHSQIIVDIVNNSQTLSSYLLNYGSNWSILYITAASGAVLPYRPGDPVYPGENATINATIQLAGNLYSTSSSGTTLLFNEIDIVFVYSNGARGEYRVVLNG